MLSTGVANTKIVCEAREYVKVNPRIGQTCGEYLKDYTTMFGGYVNNPDANTSCELCTASNTNTFLAAVNIYYKDRWRNFGIMMAFVVFNIFAAVGLYWLARVPKGKRKSKTEKAGTTTTTATPTISNEKK